MANYNPHNFNLGQFMNDLYQLPNLDVQFKFLGDQFEVINFYSLMLEKELQKVSALVTTLQTPPSTRSSGCTTGQWDLQESRSVHRPGQLQWRDQPLWGMVAKNEDMAKHQSADHPSKVLWCRSSSTLSNETESRNILCSMAWERADIHLVWTRSGHSKAVLSDSKTRLGQTEALEAQTRKYPIMRLCWSLYQVLQRCRNRSFSCYRYSWTEYECQNPRSDHPRRKEI